VEVINTIKEETNNILKIHLNEIKQKNEQLNKNLSAYSSSLKQKLRDLENIRALLKECPRKYSQLIQVKKEIESKIFCFQQEKLKKELNETKMEQNFKEVNDYYKNYQLAQQKKVFRKRVLQTFDLGLKKYLIQISSSDFEQQIKFRSKC
jgi:predicted patatin/cPLA2 family phospholipase